MIRLDKERKKKKTVIKVPRKNNYIKQKKTTIRGKSHDAQDESHRPPDNRVPPPACIPGAAMSSRNMHWIPAVSREGNLAFRVATVKRATEVTMYSHRQE